MKFFSLIRGDRIVLGKKGKVIPANAYSKLVDAEELIKQVQEDARHYRQEVAEEVEALRNEAEKVGFEKGIESWSAQIAFLEQEATRLNEEMKKAVIPVALQAARKIVGREMALDPDTVADIVANNLRAVAGHRRVIVYCHKDDLEPIKAKKPELEQLFERLESLVIQDREDIQQGGCIIETEAGIINAQPDQMWTVLEAAFEKILKKS